MIVKYSNHMNYAKAYVDRCLFLYGKNDFISIVFKYLTDHIERCTSLLIYVCLTKVTKALGLNFLLNLIIDYYYY